MYRLFRLVYRLVDRYVISWLPTSVKTSLRNLALRAGRVCYPGRIVAPDASHLSGTGGQSSRWDVPTLPEWVREEMRALSTLEPDLHPEDGRYGRPELFTAPWGYDVPGQVFAALRKRVQGPVDHVLIVPWLKTGGADLGAIHFANILADKHARNVLVITTEPEESPWEGRLHNSVQFLEAGKVLARIPTAHSADDDCILVLVRLLLQWAPRTVHIMNSRLGWEAVRSYGLALGQESRLFASLYCDDFTPSGTPVGYARSYLPGCYRYLHRVITDNSCNFPAWVRAMGVPESLFLTVPYPAPAWPSATDKQICDAHPRILWAGRLDRQKRPDLVVEIARKLPQFEFDLHGASVIDQAYGPLSSNLSNVHLHGPYEDFRRIADRGYLAFLYTTAWDGLPNVLLEASAMGIPIVAPDVGGIRELVPLPHLVTDPDNISAYCSLLRALHSNPALRERWRREQAAVLGAGRNKADFAGHVAAIPGYID